MTGGKAYLYLRVSRDDPGAGESSSIQNQRELLRQFAQVQGMQVAGEFVDDGYSGTNYDRPAFRQMCREIERGKVRCVLTKDLSRLGRNSARTTDLLEEYFPAHQVRYIAVTEGYDSWHMTGGMAMTAPLMMVMNEMYARDISGKIRSAFQSKMERGEYIGHRPPYGYRRDPEERTKLAVDPVAAAVVREIFRQAAEGQAPSRIAASLNDRGIPTPSQYRPEGGTRGEKWTARGLCKMLRNPVYTGTLVQGKTEKLSFKSKTVQPVPEERWKVVAQAHEAIVPQMLFRQVQNRIVSRRTNVSRRQSMFQGVAFCGACGRSMTPAAEGRLCCGGYKNGGNRCCSNHFLEEGPLMEALWQVLAPMLEPSAEERRALEQRQANFTQGEQRRKDSTDRRRQTLERTIQRLYQDWAAGGLPEALFQTELAACQRQWTALEEVQIHRTRLLPLPKALDRQVLLALVERIEVGQGQWETDAQGKRWKRQSIEVRLRFPVPACPKHVHGAGL